jgi:hypothetical protein
VSEMNASNDVSARNPSSCPCKYCM